MAEPITTSPPGSRQTPRSEKTVLFFINGPVPTEKDRDDAWQLGTARFRNARLHIEGDSLETCDAVAGAVPEDYAKKYPVLKIEPKAPPPPPPPKQP